MKYTAKFHGRTKGAIGIFYWITAETEGDTPEAATLALYDRFEHLHRLTLTPIPPKPEGTIYQACIAAGIPTYNHYSDLYIPVTEATRALIKAFDKRPQTFVNQVEGGLWYDVPFCFDPFWEEVARKAAR